MKSWELIIPPHGGGELCTLTIEAATWMMALTEGLRQLSDPAEVSSLMCNITPHGSLEIVDSRGRRTFTIRELGQQGLEPKAAPTSGEWDRQAETQDPAIPLTEPPYAKRRTAEMVALASDFFGKQPNPGSGPATASKVAPRSAPDEVSAAVPKAVSTGTPQAVPKAASTGTPQAAPKAAPTGTPQAAPQAASTGTPQAASQAAPKAAPRAASQTAPKAGTSVGTTDSGQVATGRILLGSRAEERKMTEPAIIIDPDLVAEIERLSDDTLDEAKSPDNFAKSSLAESTLTGPSQADSTLAGPSLAGPSLAGPSLAGPSPAGPSIGEPSPAGHLWSSDEPFPQSSQDNPPTPGYEGPLAADMRPPTTEHDLAALALDRMAALTYLTDRDNALAFSLDTALKLIPSVAGAILIYDPAPSQLYLAVARGPSQPNPLGFRVPVGEGLAGFCAMNGLPLSLSHVDEDQRFHTALSSHFGISVSSIMGAPIQYEGRFYGVLELVNRQPEGPYLAEELNALACIAWQLAQRLATALAV